MTGRDRLLAALSPDLVRALEDLIDERVRERLDGLDGSGASPWLSKEEAADYLGVSVRTLERRIQKGRIRPSRELGRPLLHRDDLDRLAQAATREESANRSTSPPRGVG